MKRVPESGMLGRCLNRPEPGQDTRNMHKKNVFYAQSGGVTAVINASACGVIETARRHRDRIGKKLAEWSVALTAIPVVMSIYQLLLS